MLPDESGASIRWRMIEVKSSTSVKDYHRDDIAVQNCIAQAAGVELTSIFLAHIDNTFVYPGDGDYRGLFPRRGSHRRGEGATGRCRRVDRRGTVRRQAERRNRPSIPARSASDPFECPYSGLLRRWKGSCRVPSQRSAPLRPAKIQACEAAGVTDLRHTCPTKTTFGSSTTRQGSHPLRRLLVRCSRSGCGSCGAMVCSGMGFSTSRRSPFPCRFGKVPAPTSSCPFSTACTGSTSR